MGSTQHPKKANELMGEEGLLGHRTRAQSSQKTREQKQDLVSTPHSPPDLGP